MWNLLKKTTKHKQNFLLEIKYLKNHVSPVVNDHYYYYHLHQYSHYKDYLLTDSKNVGFQDSYSYLTVDLDPPQDLILYDSKYLQIQAVLVQLHYYTEYYDYSNA